MRRLLLSFLLLLSLSVFPVSTVSADPGGGDGFGKISIPCGFSPVPYMVYSMPLTQPETLTLTFQAGGEGLITFVVNNYVTSYWARTDATCGNCSLTIPNVQPGPLQVMQISATTAAANCPSGGMTVANFVLQITPSSPATKPVH